MAYIGTKSKKWYMNMVQDVQKMYASELKTEINARFGLHEIEKAI